MAEGPQDIKTSTFTKKLVKDVAPNFQGTDVWSHARNAQVHTHDGQQFTISNERSNSLCYEFDSTPIGQIRLRDNRLLTIQLSGEFGILNTTTCSYEKLFRMDCSNQFSFTKKPISGRSRILNNTEEYIVFGNEDIPIGELNLSKIPYKYTLDDDACQTKQYTKEVDCSQIFQFKATQPVCLSLNTSTNKTGNLPNGTYAVAICYTQADQKVSGYQSLSTPVQIFNNNGTNGALEVTISNLDRNQDYYQVTLIANTTWNGQEYSAVNNENYYTYGPFPTSQQTVYISDLTGLPETTQNLISQTRPIERVGNISGNAEYLMYSDVQYAEPINYQLQAMQIGINYVIKQVPVDYYVRNFDYGYFGDENYAPAIRWMTTKGEYSDKFDIPGRQKTSRDSAVATGDNAFETDKNLFPDAEPIQYWQMENTAGRPIPQNNPFQNDERIIATGQMGYFESTDKYPDNRLLFGDDACTPIRYPKFPDETKVPRFQRINGKLYINLRLWQFSNIEHPKDIKGNYRTDITGYEIIRKTRENGNKTVRATGYLSNLRGLMDMNRNILYQNYPFNDQGPDSFHSLTEVFSRNSKEQQFEPLTQVYRNRFSFYSPDATFGQKTALGNELKILTEERADVTTQFEEVYKHPTAKLITNTSLYLSALLGLIEAYLQINGKITKTKRDTNLTTTGVAAGVTTNTAGSQLIPLSNTDLATMDDVWNKSTNALEDIAMLKPQRILLGVLQTIAKAAGFLALAAQYAQVWLDTIQKVVKPRNYAYQSNSVASFVESKPLNKRRYVKDYQYIQPSNTQLKDSYIFNNERCNSTVYVELNQDIPAPTYQDNSNRTISEAGLCQNPTQETTGSASMYYAISKQANPNQYGPLDSGTYVRVHNCPITITLDKNDPYYTSPVLAGGDCIVTRTSFQTRRPIFSQDISNQNQVELAFNYKQYRNLGYPRFWYNSEPYEVFDIVSASPSQGKLPAQRHNLDCRKNSRNLFRIQDEYMYTSVNGVIDFIVEADANLNYREQVDGTPHYDNSNHNLSQIFRSDRLQFPEEFRLNPSFFRLESNQFFVSRQLPDFDPAKVVSRDRNAIVYSLPASKNQRVNNWRTFLPLNYYSFDNLQFGNLTGVHQLDADRIIFLFDKSSPFITLGQNQLQTTSENTITLGDGGLFAQRPRELRPTDVAYGATQSPYAFSSNPYGYFYPSASQGSLFQVGEGLNDMTNQGLYFWAKEYFSIQLRKQFPTYTENENPLNGVGYTSVYDKDYGTLYITKRDFLPLLSDISYDATVKNFVHNGIKVELNNPDYFQDISFTLSYRPQNEGFISFHDWHPDQTIQLENHFMTVKGTSIWKHNQDCNSYCNFYGKQYPFTVRPIVSYGQQVNILNSFEYQLEAYHYINNCLDKYHILDQNFDTAQVSNSEQHSGVLNLITKTEVRSKDLYNYPKATNNFTTEVLCIKKENRYRFNDFRNIVKNRGEQSHLDKYIFQNSPNGYTRTLYTQNLDNRIRNLSRMRHTYHEVELTKTDSGRNHLILKFLNSKITNSPR